MFSVDNSSPRTKHLHQRNLEEGQVAGEEATGESGETWHQVQRIGYRYKCPVCRITRNTKTQIDRHIREHEEDIDECIHSINKCDKCSHQSKTGNQIEQHKTKIHESNEIICNKYNSSCNRKNELITHI